MSWIHPLFSGQTRPNLPRLLQPAAQRCARGDALACRQPAPLGHAELLLLMAKCLSKGKGKHTVHQASCVSLYPPAADCAGARSSIAALGLPSFNSRQHPCRVTQATRSTQGCSVCHGRFVLCCSFSFKISWQPDIAKRVSQRGTGPLQGHVCGGPVVPGVPRDLQIPAGAARQPSPHSENRGCVCGDPGSHSLCIRGTLDILV